MPAPSFSSSSAPSSRFSSMNAKELTDQLPLVDPGELPALMDRVQDLTDTLGFSKAYMITYAVLAAGQKGTHAGQLTILSKRMTQVLPTYGVEKLLKTAKRCLYVVKCRDFLDDVGSSERLNPLKGEFGIVPWRLLRECLADKVQIMDREQANTAYTIVSSISTSIPDTLESMQMHIVAAKICAHVLGRRSSPSPAVLLSSSQPSPPLPREYPPSRCRQITCEVAKIGVLLTVSYLFLYFWQNYQRFTPQG